MMSEAWHSRVMREAVVSERQLLLRTFANSAVGLKEDPVRHSARIIRAPTPLRHTRSVPPTMIGI